MTLGPLTTWVFDLDGTLVNTYEAVRRAYLEVGVEMPTDAWGQPWQEWCSPVQHAAKCLVYPEFVRRYATRLPLYDFARDTRAPVLTGASLEAVRAVQQCFGPLNIRGVEQTITDKITALGDFSSDLRRVYVDDDSKALALVALRTDWVIMSPDVARMILRGVTC